MINSLKPLNPSDLENSSKTPAINEVNWKEVLLDVTKALEGPLQLDSAQPAPENLEKLLTYQRELNFYHLKVEFLSKAADSLGSVVRRLGQ